MTSRRVEAWADLAAAVREQRMREGYDDMAISKEWMEHWKKCADAAVPHIAKWLEENYPENGKEMTGMPKDGDFYATKTLLGCNPGDDRNKRFIYCWPDDRPVLVMNDRMARWTGEYERRLQIILKALNEENTDD